jgi:S1-C subfamily serine protease
MIENSKAEIIAALRPAIAMVEDVSVAVPSRSKLGDSISGTAFVADARGYLLTAKHVVQGLRAKDLKVRTTYSANRGGDYALSPVLVTAIYAHPSDDIAVLASGKTFPSGRTNLTLSTGKSLVGTDILLTGYSSGTDLVFCDDILGAGSAKSYSPVSFGGMISARIPDDGRPVELIAYDCTTFGGNSGAPVVSVESGQVIALHLRGYENHVGYGIPIDRCIPFLESVVQVHEGLKERQRLARAARRLAR